MLQWMGGARRKLKTSRKSTQARQHQFFEHRRQQLLSQATKLVSQPKLATKIDKVSEPRKDAHSLDIASLKILFRLATHAINERIGDGHCAPSGSAQNIANPAELQEYAGSKQENEPQRAKGLQGSQANLLETGVDETALWKKISVGTQWTPGSASAAAATDLSHHRPKTTAEITTLGELLKCSDNTSNVGDNNANQEVDVTLKAQTKLHKDAKLCSLQKNAENQRDSEKFRLLDLISDHEKDEHAKSSPSEFYAAYAVEGMGKVQNCTPNIDKAGRAFDQNDRIERPPNVSFYEEPNSKNVFPHVPDFVQPNKTSICETYQGFEPVDDTLVFLEADRGERLIEKGDLWSTMCAINSKLKSLSDKISSKTKAQFLSPDCNVDTSMDMLTVSSPLYSCGWEFEKFDPQIQSDVFISKESDSFSASFDHQSTNSGYQMDDYGLFDDLESAIPNRNDDVLEEVGGGNAEEILHFGTLNNGESGMDDSSISGASTAGGSPALFEQVSGDFEFDGPMTEIFSESSFSFEAANPKGFSFRMEERKSPSLCSKRLDSLQGHLEALGNADLLHEMMRDKPPEFFISPPRDTLVDCTPVFSDVHPDQDRKLCPHRHLKVEKLEKLRESASSSSVDTLFGNSCSQFPSSPTSPMLNLPQKSQKVGNLKEPCGVESLYEDIQGFLSFQKPSGTVRDRPAITFIDQMMTWVLAQDLSNSKRTPRNNSIRVSDMETDSISNASDCDPRVYTSSLEKVADKRKRDAVMPPSGTDSAIRRGLSPCKANTPKSGGFVADVRIQNTRTAVEAKYLLTGPGHGINLSTILSFDKWVPETGIHIVINKSISGKI